MNLLVLCLTMQVGLVFGLTGLIWPEKLMPAFGILMFPWRASHRAIRAHGVVVLAAYFVLLARISLTGI
ncbi:MAG TPA: hypothetical protein VHW45_14225 [Candidatus Sulfotelmatobacter sp.]|jgi:hypothetical protein|nr:hypothetical protein [Candidatus Sulfotelmatobacter sp.]